MIGLFYFVLAVLASPFKSRVRVEAENAVLRYQLIVLKRNGRGRARLTNHDRLFFIQLYRWFPSILQAVTIIRPETLVRWHRAGFRGYWRWKSRPLGGRPQIDNDWLQTSLCLRHPSARPQKSYLDQCHRTSDRGMGRATDHGGIPLGRGSALHDPRPGLHLRCGRHTPTACHGYPEQAYRTRLALAESLYRTADRIDPA